MSAFHLGCTIYLNNGHGFPSRELGGPSGKGCSLQTRLRALGPEHDSRAARRAFPLAVTRGELSPLAARGCRLPALGGQVAGGPSGMQAPHAPCAPTAFARRAHSLSCSPSPERRRQDEKEPSSCLKPGIAPEQQGWIKHVPVPTPCSRCFPGRRGSSPRVRTSTCTINP